MTSSSGTKRVVRPTRRKRGTPAPIGTLTRASPVWSSSAWCSVTSRLSDRLEMNGNGCAGSIASGVTSGKTLSR